MAIERLSDVISYSCHHKFGKEAIVLSCQSMLNEGMTSRVVRCPTCITQFGGNKGEKNPEDLMGKVPFSVLEYLLPADAISRLSRQLLRIESSLLEEKMREQEIPDELEYVKNCNQCDYAAVIKTDALNFCCIQCDKTMCPKCD